jgi:hypothetical protein
MKATQNLMKGSTSIFEAAKLYLQQDAVDRDCITYLPKQCSHLRAVHGCIDHATISEATKFPAVDAGSLGCELSRTDPCPKRQSRATICQYVISEEQEWGQLTRHAK